MTDKLPRPRILVTCQGSLTLVQGYGPAGMAGVRGYGARRNGGYWSVTRMNA